MSDGLKARVNVHGKVTPERRDQQRRSAEMWKQFEADEALRKKKLSPAELVAERKEAARICNEFLAEENRRNSLRQ